MATHSTLTFITFNVNGLKGGDNRAIEISRLSHMQHTGVTADTKAQVESDNNKCVSCKGEVW